jgi:hypothetical protein
LVGVATHHWPADDAWLKPGLEIAFAIPHIYRPAATTELMISARSAGELCDGTTVEPGAPETCNPEKSFQTA